MTASVDTRVVEMQFDNASFEKGVAKTMSSLEALSGKLDTPQTFSGVSGLAKSISSIDFSPIGSGLEFVKTKATEVFSTLTNLASNVTKGIGIGAAGLLATATGLAVTGGIKRAENIEQAKFQLEGLGVAWKDIEEDISYAVKGTAFGLDVAAKAASQLSASGVELGDNMKAALRGISGVAAMTSSDYESIASIFTAVAGQGKLMTIQLRQMELRGLNAAAVLAEAMGKSEAEVRDMVTKGEIDFETFSKAMDEAFGEHATDANKTFSGSLSNVNAALSRIGADFAANGMEHLREIFVSLIPIIDQFHEVTKPVAELLNTIFGGISENIAKFLDDIAASDKITEFADNLAKSIDSMTHYVGDNMDEMYGIPEVLDLFAQGLSSVGDTISTVLGTIKESFSSVFTDIKLPDISVFHDLATGFLDFAKSIKPNEATLNKIKTTFTALFTVMQHGITIIQAIAGAIGNVLTPVFDVLFNIASTGIDAFIDFITWLASLGDTVTDVSDLISSAGEAIGGMVSSIASGLPTWEDFKNVANDVLGFLHDMVLFDDGDFDPFDAGVEKANNFFTTVSGIFAGIGDVVSHAFEKAFNVIKDAFGGIASFILDALKSLSIGDILALGLIPAIIGAFNSLSSVFNSFAERISFFNLSNLLGFSPVLTALKDELRAFTAALNARILLEIAAAVGILAISAKSLSEVDPVALGKSVAALAALAGVLSGSIIAMSKMVEDPKMLKGISKLTGVFLSMSISIGILAGAVRALSKIDVTSLAKSIGAIAVLMGLLVGMAVALGKYATKMISGGIGLTFMANALLVMSLALKVLSSIPIDSLAIALTALAVSLGLITGAMILMSRYSKHLISFSVGILSMAAAMLVMAASLKVLSTIPMNDMGTALIGLAGAFAIMTLAMIALSEFSNIRSAVGMMAIAVALLAIAPALMMLSTIPLDSIGAALLSLAGSMVIMVGAMALLSAVGTPTGVVGLLAVAVALLAIAPALKMLSTIPFEGVASSLLLLAGALTILGLAAVLIPAPLMLALAASLLAISVGFLAIGAGVTLAGVGMMLAAVAIITLAAGLEMLTKVVGGAAKALGEAFVEMAGKAGEAIVAFVTSLTNSASAIKESIATLIQGIAEGFVGASPEFGNAAVQTVLAFVEGIGQQAGTIAGAGILIIENLILGLANGIGPLVEAGAQLAIMFITGVGDAIRSNATMAYDALSSVFGTIFSLLENLIADAIESIFGPNPIADAIRANANEIGTAAEESSQKVHDAFAKKNPEIVALMNGTMDDIAGAIGAGGDKSKTSAESVAGGIFDGMLSKFTENSDLIPDEMSEQLDGLSALTGDAFDYGSDIGESEGEGMQEGIEESEGPTAAAISGMLSSASESTDASGLGSGVGANFGSGVAAGIDSVIDDVIGKARDMIAAAKQAADDEAASASPSKEMIKRGQWFGQGFAIGILNTIADVSEASSRMVDNGTESVDRGLKVMSDTIENLDWDVNPVITPVLDTSQIEDGMGRMNGLFPETQLIGNSWLGRTGAFAQSAGDILTQNTTNNYEITLDWKAGMDANAMLIELNSALKSRKMLRGV